MFAHSLCTDEQIEAKREDVWRAILNFKDYSKWSSSIKISEAEGPLQVGNRLKVELSYKTPAGQSAHAFSPVVLKLTGKELRWKGNMWGSDLLLSGEHYFRFKKQGKKTILQHGEEFRGLFVPLMSIAGMFKTTENLFEDFNQQLKRRVER